MLLTVQMVEVLHIVDDPADVGWYSGLIVRFNICCLCRENLKGAYR